jgi:hypothetical protein
VDLYSHIGGPLRIAEIGKWETCRHIEPHFHVACLQLETERRIGRKSRQAVPFVPESQLATPLWSTYTTLFHHRIGATVAQWQSTGFVNRWLWVQLPPVAREGSFPLVELSDSVIVGQVAERPMASDCKSDGYTYGGSNPSLPTVAACGLAVVLKPQAAPDVRV